MIDSFYDIRLMEEWLDESNGFILETANYIAALNMIPSTYGHTNIFTKRVVYNGSDLTSDEAHEFFVAKELVMDKVFRLGKETPEKILEIYNNWINDENLQKEFPCRKKLEIACRDFEEGTIMRAGTLFENEGEDSGQMVKQFHMQYVPRLVKGKKGGGEALFKYLHE